MPRPCLLRDGGGVDERGGEVDGRTEVRVRECGAAVGVQRRIPSPWAGNLAWWGGSRGVWRSLSIPQCGEIARSGKMVVLVVVAMTYFHRGD